jgi:hypothetical protein
MSAFQAGMLFLQEAKKGIITIHGNQVMQSSDIVFAPLEFLL